MNRSEGAIAIASGKLNNPNYDTKSAGKQTAGEAFALPLN